MKKMALIFIFAFAFSKVVFADQVIIKPSYTIEFASDGKSYYHDGSDWVGRGSVGLRTVNAWPLVTINPGWIISEIAVRFNIKSKTGATGTLSLIRYGLNHGEDWPGGADSGTMHYTMLAGQTTYGSLAEPVTGWTPWVALNQTALEDLKWCLNNSKTSWSVGLKAADTIENGTTANHVDLAEDNDPSPHELRLTYTLPSNDFVQGQTVTFEWDQSIGFGIESCKEGCIECQLVKEITLPLVSTVVDSGLTFTTNWPSVKITGGCSGDKSFDGKFAYEIVDSIGAKVLVGETTETSKQVKLDYPEGDYSYRVKSVIGAESDFAAINFRIALKRVPDGAIIQKTPESLKIK